MKSKIFDIDLDSLPIGKPQSKNVKWPSFYGVQDVEVPIYIYRASQSISPCVVITACLHGDEIPGLRIAQSLMRSKKKLRKGTLIVIPLINIYGVMNKNRYLPDRKDVNRCFPGSKTGSFGSRLAHFLFSNISRVGDVFIDLHSGPAGRYNSPQVRCDISDPNIRGFLEGINIPLVVQSTTKDGSLRHSLSQIGKMCLVFEGGEGLRIDSNDTRRGIQFVESTLRKLEMIDSHLAFRGEKIFIEKSSWIRARAGGLLITKIKKGQIIREGEVIGELRKVTGELISKLKMERDGVVLGVSRSSLIMSGDALFNIGFLDSQFLPYNDEFFDYLDSEDEGDFL